MKLAQAALLRAFMAKHRAGVPQPLGLIVQQAVLRAGAHTASGSLWAQTETVAIAVRKAVHFFFDNIGDFSNRTFKQLSLLKYRETNFAIAVTTQHIGHSSFEILPCC